jgi:uncharacterized protein (DUF885 family)
MKIPALLIVAALVLPAVSACSAGPERADTAAGDAAKQLEAYIDEYVAFRRADSSGGTRTAAEHQERTAQLRQWLDRLNAIPRSGLPLDDDIDHRLIASQLKTEIARIERERQWERFPSLYIPFDGVNRVVTNDELSEEEKGRRLLDALREAPRTIAVGKANLQRPLRLVFDQALETLATVREFYTSDVQRLVRGMKQPPEGLRDAHEQGIAALDDYRAFLETEVRPRADGQLGIGADLYNYYLRETYFLDDDVESLQRKGEGYFAETVAALEETARSIDPKRTWQQLIEENRKHHPTAENLLAEWEKEVARARRHVIEHNLVFVPDGERVLVEPTPPSRRRDSPFGTMSTPRPFSTERVGRLIINPVEPDTPADLQKELLGGHDYTFITTIAPHETYPGHHLQAMKVQDNPRPFRKVYSSVLFSEGWGLYTEQLMYETGFFTDVERTRLTQLRTQLWRAARVILDVKLQTGQITYDEARRFLEEQVLFEPSRSAGEVNMYVSRPTYFITYMTGFRDIMRLRDDYRKKKGGDFSLLEFHEAMLSTGSLPTPLLREIMLGT